MDDAYESNYCLQVQILSNDKLSHQKKTSILAFILLSPFLEIGNMQLYMPVVNVMFAIIFLQTISYIFGNS